MFKKILLTVGMLTVLTSQASAHDGYRGGGWGYRGGGFGSGIVAGAVVGGIAGVAIGESLYAPTYYPAPVTYYAPAPPYVYMVSPQPVCRQYTQSVLQPSGYYTNYVGTTCQGTDGNWYVQGR